jgi:hypothetical protein
MTDRCRSGVYAFQPCPCGVCKVNDSLYFGMIRCFEETICATFPCFFWTCFVGVSSTDAVIYRLWYLNWNKYGILIPFELYSQFTALKFLFYCILIFFFKLGRSVPIPTHWAEICGHRVLNPGGRAHAVSLWPNDDLQCYRIMAYMYKHWLRHLSMLVHQWLQL